jgi:hypothetical protein
VKLVVDYPVPADGGYGAPTRPGGGAERFDSEIVGALSKLTPRSPRMYQLEPTSNAVGPWLAGIDGGGAVPSKSAASDG